jgi:alpha-tubulin suppressor-like RCC1 family protein
MKNWIARLLHTVVWPTPILLVLVCGCGHKQPPINPNPPPRGAGVFFPKYYGLWTWGYNETGQLGDGYNGGLTRPNGSPGGVARRPEYLFLLLGTKGAGGAGHSLLVDKTGALIAWGDNSQGQLTGLPGAEEDDPTPVSSGNNIPSTVKAVAARGPRTLLVDSNGKVWLVGAKYTPPSAPNFDTLLIQGSPIQQVAAGDNHGLGLGTDNMVYYWGSDTTSNNWAEIKRPPKMVKIAAGAKHDLSLSGSAQTVYSWGDNSRGQLGRSTGSDPSDSNPTELTAPAGMADPADPIVDIACGDYHSLAVTKSGHVYAWGDNTFGQLGDGTTTNHPLPTEIPNLANVKSVAAGDGFSVALKSDGTVWTWGTNLFGQLGIGSYDSMQTTPVKVNLPKISWIAAGESHVLAMP